MARTKIKLKDQLGRVVRVGGDAKGATVGKDLRWPDGSLVKVSDIRNPSTDTGSTGGMAATVWKLIREVPANIQKLAKLAGAGFTTRGPDGEWYQRSIEAGEGIDVVDGDGVAGNPTIGLADLPDAGGGALLKIVRDAKGRVSGTSDPTTDDLPEGVANLYYTDERAAAAAPVQSVNGQTGDVVLDASDVGADASGAAAAAVAAHVAESDPHPQYQQKLPPGTTGQFLRGDGLFSNILHGPLQLSMSLNGEQLYIENYGFATVWASGRANGTEESPTAVIAGQSMMRIAAIGYDGSSFLSGAYIEFSADGAVSSGSIPTRIDFRTGDGSVAPPIRWRVTTDGVLRPGANGLYDVGTGAIRPREYFGVNGTINTSDAREKTPVRPFTDREIAAAIELGNEIGMYQWLAMIEKKGDAGARLHIGMTVQRAIEIMLSHGLDPMRYGFICYDSWTDIPEEIDDDGNVKQPFVPAGNLYSFRITELLAFIARGFAHRLTSIEQRLAAAGL